MRLCKYLVTGQCSKHRMKACPYVPYSFDQCIDFAAAKDIERTKAEKYQNDGR